MSSRAAGTLILAVLGVGVVAVGMTLPWYGFESTASGFTATLVYRLSEVQATGSAGGFSGTDVGSYTEYELAAQGRVADIAFWISALALVSLAGGAAAAAARVFLASPPTGLRPTAGALLALGGLAAIVAPLVFGILMPGAFEADSGPVNDGAIAPQNDFAGTNGGMTWGPASGWYVVAAAAVPAFGAAALMLAPWRRMDGALSEGVSS